MPNLVESNYIEYKSDIPEKSQSFKAEIVSFLNSDGGEILLGVDDNGQILPDQIAQKRQHWMELLSEWLSNAFYPPVHNLITLHPNETPFRIAIKRGVHKPYYFTEGNGGFNYKGVYIRIGSSKKPADFDEIIRMSIESSGSSYEKTTSPEQDLTFIELERLLEHHNLKLNKHALFFYTEEQKYNIAALLFSDQNPTTTKVGIYRSLTDYENMVSMREFEGSICQQINDIMQFLKLHNNNTITFSAAPERHETYDYPEQALREALINCFCHRDWSFKDNIKISIFPNRIKMQSPGSLTQGLELNDILAGTCSRRNDIIVNVLNKIKYIEAYGTGIRKIRGCYHQYGSQLEPEFDVTHKKFAITLYNINYFLEQHQHQSSLTTPDLLEQFQQSQLNGFERDAIIYYLLQKRCKFTHFQLAQELQITLGTLLSSLNSLQTQNLLDQHNNVIEALEWYHDSHELQIQQAMLKILLQNPTISVQQLAQQLQVSLETVYKNLVALENQNRLEYKGKTLGIILAASERPANPLTQEDSIFPEPPANNSPSPSKIDRDQRQQLILQHLEHNSKSTVKILAQQLDVSIPTIARDLKELKEAGLLTFIGKPRNGTWKVLSKV